MSSGLRRSPVLPGVLLALWAMSAVVSAQEPAGYGGTMRFLQEQMHRITDGFMVDDLEVVAEAARAIAEAPRVPAAERVRIVALLGPDVEQFERIEYVVRNLARGLEQAAGRSDRGESLHTYFRLMDSCLACHRDFQERVGAGLAAERK